MRLRGLAALLLACASLLAACSDDEGSAEDPCAAWPDQCAFARDLESHVSAGDTAATASQWAPVTVTCPNPAETGGGAPVPLCNGAPEGESRTGYRTGNETVGFVYAPDQLGDWVLFNPVDPQASDRFGNGTMQLISIGCPVTDQSLHCEDHFAVALSGIAVGNPRVVHYAVVDRQPDSSFKISEMVAIGGGLGFDETFAGSDAIPFTSQRLGIDRFWLVP